MQFKWRYLYFKTDIYINKKVQIYLTKTEIYVFEMKISLVMNLIIFNFYFQQMITTSLLKVFDMLDIYQASECPDIH